MSLQTVWNQVEYLLSQGLSLIPVRDTDQGDYKAKTPYRGWKQYQSSQISASELFNQMSEIHNTTAIAIICGKISGSLEVIDVDVKNWPGIDALLFQSIQDINPNLWHRLRIHKSPSGGYHILYKVIGGTVPGNAKLAKRSEIKGYAIETRGEGGYVLGPPSLGYAIFKQNDIPIVTWEDRCTLIEICKSFNEEIRVSVPPKQTKSEESYYDENPFEHFNRVCDIQDLMQLCGWSYFKTSGRFMWFTKPGGKTKDVHGTFNIEKRLVYVWTTGAGIDSEKWFQPSTFLSESMHTGDKKKTYAYLVQNGYGKVKERIENRQIKQKAISGEKLPENFSAAAKAAFKIQVETLHTQHPYGIFWELNEDDAMAISREKLFIVADCLGFKIYEDDLYRVLPPFIHSQTEREFYDVLKEYIQEEDAEIYEDICNAYEAFMQRNGAYTISRLRLLDEGSVLTDTRDVAYKFFDNCFLYISSEHITVHTYPDLKKLVFFSRVQKRKYEYYDGGIYIDFINTAIGSISLHVQKCIGFLTHEYKDETMAYIIILTETCPDPKQGGGSGKNVFCDLLKYSTSYISKPGSQTKFDEKFFQTWSGQRVFGISDIPKDFDFTFLKEPASGTFVWKKLFKDERIVGPEKAPKFVVQTNFSYEVSDGGLKRRLIPVEFTDFFTKSGGLDVHYGKHFPNDWDEKDWNGYDTFVAKSIQLWLSGGRKLSPVSLSQTGWEKQFLHSYGQVCSDLISAYWMEWLSYIFVSNEKFKENCDYFYNTNAINMHYRPSMSRINKALDEYATHFGVKFSKDYVKRDGPITTKGKFFEVTETPF